MSEIVIIKHQGQQAPIGHLLSKMKDSYPAVSWIGVTDWDVIDLADKALYEVEKSGKNKIKFME